MLKVIDYLKKEKSNSEVPKILEEVQHIEQAQKFSKLKRYRRFDSDDEREKNTELFSAIRNGNLQKVQELLKVGVKVNIIDKNNAPLHYAIKKGNKEIVEELLVQKWKTDINAKNNKGDTPLHIATSKGNKELVQLLLSKQVKTDIKNNEGKTPLELAKDQEIINILKSGSALDYNDNHIPDGTRYCWYMPTICPFSQAYCNIPGLFPAYSQYSVSIKHIPDMYL